MKITFIRDAVPTYYTGWSFYAAGTKADLRHAETLIEQGLAVAGWEVAKPEPPPAPEPEPEPEPVAEAAPEPEPEPPKPAPKKTTRRTTKRKPAAKKSS